LGAPVYDAANVRVGSINDFVMRADGSLSGVSVKRTTGGWLSPKSERNIFVVPMGFVQWSLSHSGEWTAKLTTGLPPAEKALGESPK
jgi:hypothetical protein